jgi:hypothetical protein
VIVMTKTGHRQAMVELKQMIHGWGVGGGGDLNT